MDVIPQNGDEPEICLFQTIAELRESLGHAYTHGMYNPKTNQIFATWHSLPHEIGHYKDFQSGKMQDTKILKTEQEKLTAQLRNEIVAVLFAWQKHPDLHSFLSHEKEFLECFYYMLEHGLLEMTEEFKKVSFEEIQNLAEEVSKVEHPLFEKTKNLFRHYLDENNYQIY